jgi:hypothetical protein
MGADSIIFTFRPSLSCSCPTVTTCSPFESPLESRLFPRIDDRSQPLCDVQHHSVEQKQKFPFLAKMVDSGITRAFGLMPVWTVTSAKNRASTDTEIRNHRLHLHISRCGSAVGLMNWRVAVNFSSEKAFTVNWILLPR